MSHHVTLVESTFNVWTWECHFSVPVSLLWTKSKQWKQVIAAALDGSCEDVTGTTAKGG